MTVKPTTITATYRIVTPMFCSGANQQSAELRVASFKGALRFWWRTLMAGKFGNDIDALHRAEASLFGSSERAFGQSKVRLRLRYIGNSLNPSELEKDWPQNRPAVGSTYLGYGITETGRKGEKDYKPHRIGLKENGTFEVRCSMPTECIEWVTRALVALGLFGGLGNRSRRGFGSISIQQLNEKSYALKDAEHIRSLAETLTESSPSQSSLPEFTGFSTHARLYVGPVDNSARIAHEALGETYRNFRGQPSSLRGRSKIPIGLPLQGVDSRRRASPLLMHIHPVGNQFVPIVLFLPSVFHPEIQEGNKVEFYRVIQKWMVSLNATEVKFGR